LSKNRTSPSDKEGTNRQTQKTWRERKNVDAQTSSTTKYFGSICIISCPCEEEELVVVVVVVVVFSVVVGEIVVVVVLIINRVVVEF
jgi:hypothetical protein